MSRHTKAWVIHTRRVQLLLRVFSLLGAIGILFCVICISHTDVVLGWIIRVAVCSFRDHEFPQSLRLTVDLIAKCCHTSHCICHLPPGTRGRQ